MKVAVFSAKPYDRQYLSAALRARASTVATTLANGKNSTSIKFIYHSFPLSLATAPLARGCIAVCVFVNDIVDSAVLHELHAVGVHAILLRCAGFNNIDLTVAKVLGMRVANCAYAPESIAEFAVALIQTLNRQTHRAYLRVREGNFSLDGMAGRTLKGKTVGVVGTGKIGVALAQILGGGFGCRVLAYDPYAGEEAKRVLCDEAKGKMVATLDELLRESDIVSLHCPLVANTEHLIDTAALALMKKDAMLVNTSRGGLVDTKAVLTALKAKALGGLALDVYEGEAALFYSDHSGEIIEDDDLARLRAMPNVLLCGHQAWFTQESLNEIATCVLTNLDDFLEGREGKYTLVKGEVGSTKTLLSTGETCRNGTAGRAEDERRGHQ